MRNRITAIATTVTLAFGGLAVAQKTPEPSKPGADILQQAAGPDVGEAALGSTIYLRYCAVCHGRSLKGDGPIAVGLINKPVDLTALAAKNKGTFPYDKVVAMIDGRQTTRMHGTPDMPVWGDVFTLTEGTDAPNAEIAIKRLTHYIWSSQTKAKEAAQPK
ncbi:MAG: cytochrome C [Vicinamibacteria bacterium]